MCVHLYRSVALSAPSDINAATALALLASHEERETTVKATKAREQFFPLLESVVKDGRQVVYVEHKDLPGRALLVSEGYQTYVRALEATVRALVGPAAGPHFALAGSLSLPAESLETLDDQLAAWRATQADRAASKFGAL